MGIFVYAREEVAAVDALILVLIVLILLAVTGHLKL
jgi:hypothetical protein